MKTQTNENSFLTENTKQYSTDEDAVRFINTSGMNGGVFLIPKNHSLSNVESIKEEPFCTSSLTKRVIASSIVATGTGLAMMPVFNNLVKNSDKFGIDIHSNKVLFDLSTANTFIIYSFSSFITMNEFIKKHQNNEVENDVCKIKLAKVCASFSLILPLGMLWLTEANNQTVAKSKGFDEYIAWATFTSVPLITNQVIDSITHVNKLLINEEDKVPLSTGGKLMLYGLAASSIAGRAIAYTEVTKSLALASGFSQELSLGMGIIGGGILTSLGVSILEHSKIKLLCETQDGECNFKKFIACGLSLTQGLWFTLPLISIGLDATSNWNPLLKGALFVPLLISHTALESSNIYDNVLTFCDYVSDGFSHLRNCCYGEEVQIAGMYDDVDFITNE